MRTSALQYIMATALLECARFFRLLAARMDQGRAQHISTGVKKKAENLLLGKSVIRLEIGATEPKTDEWVCIDRAGGNLRWDVTKGIPFPNESFVEVYSSHTFEHFSVFELAELIGEIYRTLQPDGLLSCAVPDAERYLKAYSENRVFRDGANTYASAFFDTGSKIDIVNYIAYLGGEHKVLLDSEMLQNLYRIAGFKEVGIRGFDSSLDLRERQHESVYVWGRK